MNAVKDIVARVVEAVGKRPRDLSRPQTGLEERNSVDAKHFADANVVREFEQQIARITGAKHVVVTSSGTAALHLALLACGIGPGDEVIVPSLTFAATAFAVRYCGAKPHFVDVNTESLGINAFKCGVYLEGYHRTVKAILAVHLLGMPCELARLQRIADDWQIPLIEDAAQAFGAHHFLGHCGTVGKVGVLSFNLNKIVTAGGGGALLTNDKMVAECVWHLAHQAKKPHLWAWEHDAIGFNYRMPPLCAALGLAQSKRLQSVLTAKTELALAYWKAFEGCQYAEIIGKRQPGANHWLNAIQVKNESLRDEVLAELGGRGYEARALFTPLHMLPPFTEFPRQGDLRVAESLWRSVVCLPSSVVPEQCAFSSSQEAAATAAA